MWRLWGFGLRGLGAWGCGSNLFKALIGFRGLGSSVFGFHGARASAPVVPEQGSSGAFFGCSKALGPLGSRRKPPTSWGARGFRCSQRLEDSPCWGHLRYAALGS